LFAVALDVEVDHHGRKGHHLLPVSCDQTQPRPSLAAPWSSSIIRFLNAPGSI
jgi:hypothetical protein